MVGVHGIADVLLDHGMAVMEYVDAAAPVGNLLMVADEWVVAEDAADTVAGGVVLAVVVVAAAAVVVGYDGIAVVVADSVAVAVVVVAVVSVVVAVVAVADIDYIAPLIVMNFESSSCFVVVRMVLYGIDCFEIGQHFHVDLEMAEPQQAVLHFLQYALEIHDQFDFCLLN